MYKKRYIHRGCTSFYLQHNFTVPTVQDLLKILQQFAPDHLAEDWDNVGLLVGDPRESLQRILIALDPSCSLIDQARAGQYDCIITHHPVIFRPLKTLRRDTPAGRFISAAARDSINIIACHTNLDSTPGGISDYLANAMGLTGIRPLVQKTTGTGSGLGRIGSYQSPIAPGVLLDKLRNICTPPWILEAGPRPEQITTVAICGGSCSDFAEIALTQGADVFITAEVKHSVARWAEDAALWLLDAGHFSTEHPAMLFFQTMLLQHIAGLDWDVKIDIATQQPPLNLVRECP